MIDGTAEFSPRPETSEQKYEAIVTRVQAWTSEQSLTKGRTNWYDSPKTPRGDVQPKFGDLEYGVQEYVAVSGRSPNFNRASVFTVTGNEYETSQYKRKRVLKDVYGWWIISGSRAQDKAMLYVKYGKGSKTEEISEGGWWSADGLDPTSRIQGAPIHRVEGFKQKDVKDVFEMTYEMLTDLKQSVPLIRER